MPLRKSTVRVLRSIAIASVLIIACASIVLATPAEDAYKQDKDLLDKKDYKGAIAALDKAIILIPFLWVSGLILFGALTVVVLIAWRLIARRRAIKLGTKAI